MTSGIRVLTLIYAAPAAGLCACCKGRLHPKGCTVQAVHHHAIHLCLVGKIVYVCVYVTQTTNHQDGDKFVVAAAAAIWQRILVPRAIS